MWNAANLCEFNLEAKNYAFSANGQKINWQEIKIKRRLPAIRRFFDAAFSGCENSDEIRFFALFSRMAIDIILVKKYTRFKNLRLPYATEYKPRRG